MPSAAKRSRRAPRTAPAAPAPSVLLVAPPRRFAALLRAFSAQGWPVREAATPRAAEQALTAAPADVAVVPELATPRATVSLLRRLGRAAPALARLVLLRGRDPQALLAYANQGGARHLLPSGAGARGVVRAIRQLRSERERERLALLSGSTRGQALRALQSETQTRTKDLSRANRELRRAVREIAEKNRALTTLNESLRIQSTTDPLTGLYNRREFLNRIRTEWGRFRRYGRPLGMIMLDIDHFKRINDTYGHECGDVVLRSLGRLIAQHKRAQDLCCRYGGEEFVVLLTETTLDAAFHVAEEMRRRIGSHPFEYDDQPIQVRVSLGVSGAAEQNPADVEAFINLADKAMYRAKREGRDRTVVLDAADESRILLQSRHEETARKAPHAKGAGRRRHERA